MRMQVNDPKYDGLVSVMRLLASNHKLSRDPEIKSFLRDIGEPTVDHLRVGYLDPVRHYLRELGHEEVLIPEVREVKELEERVKELELVNADLKTKSLLNISSKDGKKVLPLNSGLEKSSGSLSSNLSDSLDKRVFGETNSVNGGENNTESGNQTKTGFRFAKALAEYDNHSFQSARTVGALEHHGYLKRDGNDYFTDESIKKVQNYMKDKTYFCEVVDKLSETFGLSKPSIRNKVDDFLINRGKGTNSILVFEGTVDELIEKSKKNSSTPISKSKKTVQDVNSSKPTITFDYILKERSDVVPCITYLCKIVSAGNLIRVGMGLIDKESFEDFAQKRSNYTYLKDSINLFAKDVRFAQPRIKSILRESNLVENIGTEGKGGVEWYEKIKEGEILFRLRREPQQKKKLYFYEDVKSVYNSNEDLFFDVNAVRAMADFDILKTNEKGEILTDSVKSLNRAFIFSEYQYITLEEIAKETGLEGLTENDLGEARRYLAQVAQINGNPVYVVEKNNKDVVINLCSKDLLYSSKENIISSLNPWEEDSNMFGHRYALAAQAIKEGIFDMPVYLGFKEQFESAVKASGSDSVFALFMGAGRKAGIPDYRKLQCSINDIQNSPHAHDTILHFLENLDEKVQPQVS